MPSTLGRALGLCLLLGTATGWADDAPVPASPTPPGPAAATPTPAVDGKRMTADRATLERALAALPAGWMVRTAEVTQDADGALVLTDVVLSRDGRLLLAAASVRLVGLRGDGSAGAPYAADRVEATSLGEPGANAPSSADSLVISGLAIGPGDAAGMPAGSTAAAIIQALTATRVEHAELLRLHDKDGTIGNVALDHLMGGKITAGTISDISWQDPHDGRHFTIAAIETADLDVARLVRVFEPSSYAKDAARLAIGSALGRFAVRGVALIKADETTTLIDAIELTDLQVGQSPQAPTVAALFTVPVALGNLVVGGVHRRPVTASDPSLDIASIALNNYRHGQFDALRIGETRFSEPKSHAGFGMKSAELLEFDASGALAWAALGERVASGQDPGTPDPADPDAATPDAASPESAGPGAFPTPRLGGFNVIDLFVDAPTGDRVTIGAIRDRLAYQDAAPVLQEFSISRLMVPTHLLEQLVDANAVTAFGGTSLAADLLFRLVWDPATHDLKLTPLQLVGDALGTLTLTLTLGNIDLSLLSKGAVAGMAGLIVATIKDGELVYTDHSLLRRAIGGYAATVGQTPAEVTNMLVTTLTNMKSPLPSRPQLLTTLAEFIQHPGGLTARITPATPVPAGQLAAGSPDDTAKRLGLVVTAQ